MAQTDKYTSMRRQEIWELLLASWKGQVNPAATASNFYIGRTTEELRTILRDEEVHTP